MKFDHIIMNPPYCKNLHLKILNEAIKYSDDIVNLSPIRWLQDPLAEYKKNSDWKKFENIRNHIESVAVINAKDATVLFSAGFIMNLGIYHITDKGGWDGFDRNSIIMKEFIIETSARHVHVTQEALEVLFGKDAQLEVKKMLSQPGQYASNQKVQVVGPKGVLNCSILGPVRN